MRDAAEAVIGMRDTEDGTRRARRRADSGGDRAGGRQGGFALLAALLALVGMTALATGGWLLASSEDGSSRAYRGSVEAFYVAQTGLHQFLRENQGIPAPEASYQLAGGRVEVRARSLGFTAKGRELYRVAAEGRTPDGGSRRVVRVAVLEPFVANMPGTLVSGAGVIKNGSSGTIDGDDASLAGECPVGGEPTGPALYVADDGQPGYETVPSSVPEGDPPIQEISDPLAPLGVDWQSVVDGRRLVPDYEVPADGWPDFSSLDADAYPVVYASDPGGFAVDGNDDGRGLLVVRGDLNMGGSFRWDGLVLVGGAIISDGRQHITGGVVTGLNATLDPPESVQDTDLGNGNMDFGYDACEIWKASRAAGVLVPRPSTWSEEF